MKVHLDVKFSNISKLDHETVFSAVLGGNECLCILLHSQGTKHTVAVLSTRDRPPHAPYWVEIQHGAPCLSYGADCLIEPIVGPESVPRSSFTHRHSPGVLTLNEEGGLLMYFKSISFGYDEIGFDFKSGEFGHISGHNEVYFQRWKLWRNPHDRLQKGAEPLLEFDLTRILAIAQPEDY